MAPPVYGNAALPPGGAGRLRLRRVSVHAAGRAVLQDVDLDLPAGALVAVIGRSGSGKSTVAALAGRLLDPDRGEVTLDGVPLRDLSHAELRRAVAYGFGLFSRALTAEAMSGRFHGNDERIDVESLALTTQAWLDTCELFLG